MLNQSNSHSHDSQPHPGPDAIVRSAQRKRLERGHKHHKPAGKGERYGPLGGGTWVRKGCKRVRGDLDGWRLIDAVEWMADRRFTQWTSADQSVLDELAIRTFAYPDLERRIVVSQPSWLGGLVREQWGEDGPGWPRSAGFMRFMADLVHARRSHAVGLWLSQVDAATLYDVSDRTFRRWVAHAESVQLIRVVQTWCEDRIRSCAHRRWGRLLYMLGSAVIERAGPALYEGLELNLPDGRSMQPVAQYHARKLRRERKAHMRQRHDDLWQAHKITARERQSSRGARPVPSFNSPDMVSRSARQARETGGDHVPHPPREKILLPTSTHKVTTPRCGENKVAPPGRISVSPPAQRVLDEAIANTVVNQEAHPGALSDPASGPLSPRGERSVWRGGGDIGAMLTARMRSGFGLLLVVWLGLLSACASTESTFFYFFSPGPITEALDAQNKDGYDKRNQPNTTDAKPGQRTHPERAAGEESEQPVDIPRAGVLRRPADRFNHRHAQTNRHEAYANRRRTAHDRVWWPAEWAYGVVRRAELMAGMLMPPRQIVSVPDADFYLQDVIRMEMVNPGKDDYFQFGILFVFAGLCVGEASAFTQHFESRGERDECRRSILAKIWKDTGADLNLVDLPLREV